MAACSYPEKHDNMEIMKNSGQNKEVRLQNQNLHANELYPNIFEVFYIKNDDYRSFAKTWKAKKSI